MPDLGITVCLRGLHRVNMNRMNRSLPRLFYVYLFLSSAMGCAIAQPAPGLENLMPPEKPKIAQSGRSEPLPLPRDPDIAVREEFDAARARGTIEAWELFIARHGNHRLAAEARKELERLKQRRTR
jgi:hypothetical protein